MSRYGYLEVFQIVPWTLEIVRVDCIKKLGSHFSQAILSNYERGIGKFSVAVSFLKGEGFAPMHRDSFLLELTPF